MIKIMKFFIKQNKKGFTLIEALVSISLIMIAVIGPLSLIMNSINSIMQSRNRIIASYLAEEIIEDFRSHRDSFVLACKNIQYDFSTSITPDSATCVHGNADIAVSKALLLDVGYNPKSIAWKLFLDKINTLNTGSDLDMSNESFPEDLNDNISEATCSIVKFDDNPSSGYSCLSGSPTIFDRKVKLTVIGETTLKIEVEVVYAKAKLLLEKDKTIKVIDYIYER